MVVYCSPLRLFVCSRIVKSSITCKSDVQMLFESNSILQFGRFLLFLPNLYLHIPLLLSFAFKFCFYSLIIQSYLLLLWILCPFVTIQTKTTSFSHYVADGSPICKSKFDLTYLNRLHSCRLR